MGIIGKTLKFIGGLALGAVAGAAGAMLLAPQSGARTRDEIKARVDEIMEAGKDAQRERERELQQYWEQQVNVKYQDKDKK
jgi:gas vesicle protein